MFRKRNFEQSPLPWEWRRFLRTAGELKEKKVKAEANAAEQRLRAAQELAKTLEGGGNIYRTDVDVSSTEKEQNRRAHANMIPAPFPELLDAKGKDFDFWLRIYHNLERLINELPPKYDLAPDQIKQIKEAFPTVDNLYQLSRNGRKTLRRMCELELKKMFRSDEDASRTPNDFLTYDTSDGNGRGSISFPYYSRGQTTDTGSFAELPGDTQTRIRVVIKRLNAEIFGGKSSEPLPENTTPEP